MIKMIPYKESQKNKTLDEFDEEKEEE